MLNAIEAIDPWKPVLILDVDGNSETFFKYKGNLTMTYLPGEVAATNWLQKFKYCVSRGDTCVLSIGQDEDPNIYHTVENFPIEMQNKDALTYDFLKKYWPDSDDPLPCSCNKDYKFVVVMKVAEPPAWVGYQPDHWHVIKIE